MNTLTKGFTVYIITHTEQALITLESPDRIKFVLGEALDELGIEEDIDYTLDVKRAYK